MPRESWRRLVTPVVRLDRGPAWPTRDQRFVRSAALPVLPTSATRPKVHAHRKARRHVPLTHHVSPVQSRPLRHSTRPERSSWLSRHRHCGVGAGHAGVAHSRRQLDLIALHLPSGITRPDQVRTGYDRSRSRQRTTLQHKRSGCFPQRSVALEIALCDSRGRRFKSCPRYTVKPQVRGRSRRYPGAAFDASARHWAVCAAAAPEWMVEGAAAS
jgi:hypothetical protein